MLPSCGKTLSKIISSQSKSNLKAGYGLCYGLNQFHSSPFLNAGQDWRRQRGLPSNPNAYGPLTDGPDYSFVDGRPTPPGRGKVMRALEQRDIAKKIIELSKEVDLAVDLHKQRDVDEQKAKDAILDRKLKRKAKPS